ncbi:hypothetical protein [Actinophytocola sp.]|uniref:hypothetical protein n=1 Tax=Actinophytocola sp. TaxID=1872138 RepID=UPI003D6A0F2A
MSVLDRLAADPDVFLRPAQAVSGIVPSIIQATYGKLTTGCLTWNKECADTAPSDGIPQPEQELPARAPVTATRRCTRPA